MNAPLEETDPEKLQARGIARLLEEIGHHIYPDRGPQQLHPRQWSALRYFSRFGPATRTITGLARYAGITKAPASRCVQAMVRKGLLRPSSRQPDRKSKHYEVTQLGLDLLQHDPLDIFANRLKRLTPDQRQYLTQALEILLKAEKREE